MDLNLGPRGALVIGANGGIGRALCHALVREQIDRLTLAVRTVEHGDALANELADRGMTKIQVVECDLSDPAASSRCVEEAEARNGPVDVLALCAGAAPNIKLLDFDDAAWEAWAATIQTKLISSARLIRAAVPRMMERGWGRVVVVTGMTSRAPKAGGLIGGSVNVALINLVTGLAKEVAASGVNINTVDPAFVRTPRWERRLVKICEDTGVSEEEAIAEILRSVPYDRMTSPEEVADVIAFLSSDRASVISGSAIHVDHAAYPGL